ncbi:ankyrin repeat protein [Penicillium herquei]|nr:ankyrin repeat protein [Penicillium herquei]
MSLESLPVYLRLMVMSYLESKKDKNALARTNRNFWKSLNRELYASSISDLNFSGIFWAAQQGRLQTLQYFLHAAAVGFHLAPKGSNLKWRPCWEVMASCGGRFKGNPLEPMPLFIYQDGAMNGQVAVVKLLAEKIPWRLDEIDWYEDGDDEGCGATPLVLAISWGYFQLVETLLGYGAKSHQTFRRSSLLNLATATLHLLSIAALLNKADCAQVLLKYGAKPNLMEPNGEISLHIALEHGSLETAAILIQHGARVDMTDFRGHTALHYALLPGERVFEYFKLLLDNGFPKLTREWMLRVMEFGHSPVGVTLPPNIITSREAINDSTSQRVRNANVPKFWRVFWTKEYTLTATTPLVELYCIKLHTGCAQIPSNFSFHEGAIFRPTTYSLKLSSIEILRMLLSEGADPNCQDDNGQTPLHIAAQVGNFGAIGALIEWAPESGDTGYYDKDMTTYGTIVSRHLEVTALDNSGSTSFHLGATGLTSRSNSDEILYWLNAVGDSCECTTDDGEGPCETLRRRLLSEN